MTSPSPAKPPRIPWDAPNSRFKSKPGNYPRIKSSRGVRGRARDNRGKVCEVSGCHKLRSWTNVLCERHRQTRRWLGHPKARPVKVWERREHLRQIRAVLKVNLQSSEVREAIDSMQHILTPGQEPWSRLHQGPAADKRKLWADLTRVEKAGVSPQVALEHALSTWLFLQDSEGRCPSQDALAYAVAWSVLRLAPPRYTSSIDRDGKQVKSAKRISGGSRRLLGFRLLESLSRFSVQVMYAVERNPRSVLTLPKPLKPRKPLTTAKTRRRATPAASRITLGPSVRRPQIAGRVPDSLIT